MKKINYPIQNYKPYSLNNNDSEHEETIVPGKALLSVASREVVAPSFKDYMLERMSQSSSYSTLFYATVVNNSDL